MIRKDSSSLTYSISLLILITCFFVTSERSFAQQKKVNLTGYIVLRKETVPNRFNGGFSMYPTIWPLLDYHPGKKFQSGLFGTWMYPQNAGNPSTKIGSEKTNGIGYNTIEGGSGVWRSNHFPTITPKFQMGGVACSFKAWANGTGTGKGRDWANPKGSYGVAQLSPWVLFPPDGLNYKQGTSGKILGYGYLPLPFSDRKKVTSGHEVPTGNNSWTLFMNTKTFKGPLAFFTPFYWSRHTIDYPRTHGKHLDSRPSKANRQIQMETQHISAIHGSDTKGGRYVRVVPMNYPINEDGVSVIFNKNTCYTKGALWDSVDAWFKGGAIASGKIDEKESFTTKIKADYASTWKIKTAEDKFPIDWKSFAKSIQVDQFSASFEWESSWVTLDHKRRLAKLPEYYQLGESAAGDPIWKPIRAEDVPNETKLKGLQPSDFYTGDNSDTPYITPEEEQSVWKSPGPSAGPFYTKLGDGSQLTYYWYKFSNQPAIQFADYSDAERVELQRRVELIHRHWGKDQEYLPRPTIERELAELDPGVIVTPPKGLEIGYVPIVTGQKYAE